MANSAQASRYPPGARLGGTVAALAAVAILAAACGGGSAPASPGTPATKAHSAATEPANAGRTFAPTAGTSSAPAASGGSLSLKSPDPQSDCNGLPASTVDGILGQRVGEGVLYEPAGTDESTCTYLVGSRSEPAKLVLYQDDLVCGPQSDQLVQARRAAYARGAALPGDSSVHGLFNNRDLYRLAGSRCVIEVYFTYTKTNPGAPALRRIKALIDAVP